MNNKNGAVPAVPARVSRHLVRNGVVAAALAAVMLLAGCATTGSKAGGDSAIAEDGVPQALQRRAVERWELLIAGEPEKAYEFLTPGFRSTVSRQEYARKALLSRIKWTAARWRDGICTAAESCVARMEVQYSVSMPSAGDVPSQTLMSENWLQVEGEWFFLPES